MRILFPIKVRYENSGVEEIIKESKFLKRGEPFIILETNVLIKKKRKRKPDIEKKETAIREIIHYMFIQPALTPIDRQKIEACLEKIGYIVHGGGTMLDMSECDISFSKKDKK